MSVPADMMARISQGQGKGEPMPGGAMPGPAAAPMSAPQKPEGKEEQAHVRVHIGMNMLEQAIVDFQPDSKEYKTCLDVLQKLAKAFGENDTSDLAPAEIKSMVGAMPQAGGGSPQQQQIQQMLAANKPAQLPQQPQPMPQP